ncbi:MAG: hypothetical protein ABSF64_24285 [Bryobacteraceae bacterium]|jgi:hypothetical protein
MKEESCGNGGVVERVENQEQVYHFPTAFSWVERRKNQKAADCVGEEKGDTSIEA